MSLSIALPTLWVLAAVSSTTAATPRGVNRVPRTEMSHPCSRAQSRIVRQRFNSFMRKKKAGERSNSNITWPDQCPFSPLVDLFGWHERNKTRGKAMSGEWKCGYSGKSFKNEHYIDLHLDRFYNKEVPENGVCLADYCSVFEFCNVKEPSFFDSLSAEPPPCDPGEMDGWKSTCHSVIDRCVLADDPANPTLNADLHRIWCDVLTCDARKARHLHNRKWCIIIGVIALVFVLGIFFLCVCVVGKENPDSPEYRARKGLKARDRRLPARPTSGTSAGGDEIIDLIPTRPSNKDKFE